MATLKQIAHDIASSIGVPSNGEVINRIKTYILEERASFFRRNIDRNGVDAIFKHRYIAELKLVSNLYTNIEFPEEVTTTEEPTTEEPTTEEPTTTEESSQYVLRTVNKIPNPIRYKAPQPFIYVGGVDLKKPFVYSEGWELDFSQYLPLINPQRVIRFSYINGYIYLDKNDIESFVGKKTKNHIAIVAVYENPFLSYNKEDNESGIHYDDDMEFPITYDLLTALKTAIVKGNFIRDLQPQSQD
jgi:hypothetical protein